MAKNIKKYKVGIDSETYAVSLVENPAIEETFVYMNGEEDKMKVLLDSDEKYMVYGAILVPDKPIYRVADDGTEFYVEFTKDSIEKMSQDYLINYRQHSVTLDHSVEATEVCLVESWLKTSMTMDKSVALGLNAELPIGTWIGGFKVNNIETWNRIKDGSLKGFSVEAMIDLENFDFAKHIEEMSINDLKESGFIDAIKNAFKEAMREEKNPDIEAVTQVLENTEVALEEQTPTAVETVTETVVETPATPTVEEVTTVIETPVIEEPKVEEPKGETPNPLDEVINNLKTEVESLRKMNEDLIAKVADMSKQPSTKPINTNSSSGGVGNSNFQTWREQMAKWL
jgi:hypothetical protein